MRKCMFSIICILIFLYLRTKQKAYSIFAKVTMDLFTPFDLLVLQHAQDTKVLKLKFSLTFISTRINSILIIFHKDVRTLLVVDYGYHKAKRT